MQHANFAAKTNDKQQIKMTESEWPAPPKVDYQEYYFEKLLIACDQC